MTEEKKSKALEELRDLWKGGAAAVLDRVDVFVFPPGDDGTVQIVPAAVLVDNAMFKRLKDPQEAC